MVMPQDEFLQSRITEEESVAYKEYREDGGQLGYQEWVDAGMPTATEERAAFAWLGRLDLYLVNQMTSGAITEAEADLIWNDVYDRLFGGGKYVGLRQTTIDLPSAIRNDVERYTASLPVAEQKRIEQEARYAQQQAQDLATQRMQLPLGAGGTPNQQIRAGQEAIRRLQIQKETIPEQNFYLRDNIDVQIRQLQDSIGQITESERIKSRTRTEAELYPRGWEGEPDAPSFTKAFAEEHGMSAGAARETGLRYSQDPKSEEFANLTDEEKDNLIWVGIEGTGGGERYEPPPPKPITPPGFGGVGATGSPSWKSWFERQYPSIVSQFGARPAEEREAGDWASFLATERARIKEEFAKQSPYARGERPGAFAPKIKTVAF